MSDDTYTEEIVEDVFSAKFEEPTKPERTLLESWREVLRAGESVRDARFTMEAAARQLQQYPFLRIEDLEKSNSIFHDLISEALNVLELEIESDPECLSRTAETDEDGEETDGDGNREHYLNLLLQWKKLLYEQEKDWSPSDTDARARMAAYINAANFLMGSSGLVVHLDQIGFAFSEEDAAFIDAGVYDGEDQ